MSEENPYSPPVNQVEATPVQSAIPGLHNYASLGQRFFGKLIDVLITVPLSLVIGVGYALISPPRSLNLKRSLIFYQAATGLAKKSSWPSL